MCLKFFNFEFSSISYLLWAFPMAIVYLFWGLHKAIILSSQHFSNLKSYYSFSSFISPLLLVCGSLCYYQSLCGFEWYEPRRGSINSCSGYAWCITCGKFPTCSFLLSLSNSWLWFRTLIWHLLWCINWI